MSDFLFLANMIDEKYLSMILMYISLITSEIEHLITYLLALWMSFSLNIYLTLSPIFLLGCFSYRHWNSLYILDINIFSVIFLANILFQAVTCLFTLFMATLESQKYKILM